MADRIDGVNNRRKARDNGGLASDTLGQRVSGPARSDRSGSRDDTLDEEFDRERLEPGLNADGTGGAGADPAKPEDRDSATASKGYNDGP